MNTQHHAPPPKRPGIHVPSYSMNINTCKLVPKMLFCLTLFYIHCCQFFWGCKVNGFMWLNYIKDVMQRDVKTRKRSVWLCSSSCMFSSVTPNAQKWLKDMYICVNFFLDGLFTFIIK